LQEVVQVGIGEDAFAFGNVRLPSDIHRRIVEILSGTGGFVNGVPTRIVPIIPALLHQLHDPLPFLAPAAQQEVACSSCPPGAVEPDNVFQWIAGDISILRNSFQYLRWAMGTAQAQRKGIAEHGD
jgi:hypothetical protein